MPRNQTRAATAVPAAAGAQPATAPPVPAAPAALALRPAPAGPVQPTVVHAPPPPLAWHTLTLGALRNLDNTAALQLARAGSSLAQVQGSSTTQTELLSILLGAFEGSWSKAKDCLVFGRWPGRSPGWKQGTGSQLMLALTYLREFIHQQIQPVVQGELAQYGGASSARGLARANKTMTFLPTTGANTVTSDVDVSTAGQQTEIGIRLYNGEFRRYLATPFDAGTVFDLNVYAKGFLHGSTLDVTGLTDVLEAKKEFESVPLDQTHQDEAAHDQAVHAAAHLARFMEDESLWDQFVADATRNKPGAVGQKYRALMKAAWLKNAEFTQNLQQRMAQLRAAEPALSIATKTPGAGGPTSSWDDASEAHYREENLKMRAANSLYEEKMVAVNLERTRIRTLAAKIDLLTPHVTTDTGAATKHQRLQGEHQDRVVRVQRLITDASMYANEVYGSGDAAVQAVIGTQELRTLQSANDQNAPAGKGKKVEFKMEKAGWHNAFTDNLGDAFKEYRHLGTAHGNTQPAHWYAAFKMGKYVDRMLDALKQFADVGLMTPQESQKILGSFACQRLQDLADEHRTAKAANKNDPAPIARIPYFRRVNQASLTSLVQHLQEVGTKVHGKAMVNL